MLPRGLVSLVGCLALVACSTSGTAGPRAGPAEPSVSIRATTSGDPGAEPPDAPPVETVTADVETEPVRHAGDAADDPAIWVDVHDPAQSLVIGNDKQGALETYGLDGRLRQRLTSPTTFWGNVDVRQGVRLGGRKVDLVAAANDGVRLFSVDASSRMLVPLVPGGGSLQTGGGEGLCLYDGGHLGVFVIMVRRSGEVRQFRIDTAGDGTVSLTLVRGFAVGSESEGCVVDDQLDALYLAEEDVGLWRYGAAPSNEDARVLVDSVVPRGGHQTGDIEGLTLVETRPSAGVVISSSQAAAGQAAYFSIFDRASGSYLSSFRVVDGAGADGCSHTDGVTATAADLGPAFPHGVFICQDDHNTSPGSSGNQDFKLVGLEQVLITANR